MSWDIWIYFLWNAHSSWKLIWASFFSTILRQSIVSLPKFNLHPWSLVRTLAMLKWLRGYKPSIDKQTLTSSISWYRDVFTFMHNFVLFWDLWRKLKHISSVANTVMLIFGDPWIVFEHISSVANSHPNLLRPLGQYSSTFLALLTQSDSFIGIPLTKFKHFFSVANSHSFLETLGQSSSTFLVLLTQSFSIFGDPWTMFEHISSVANRHANFWRPLDHVRGHF